MFTAPLFPRINNHVKIITAALAVFNGVFGFIGGIVMLGTWFFPSIPLFPSIFMSAHPYLVLLGFFTTFIMLERWIGLQIVKERPQALLDLMLIITDLGAVILLTAYMFQIITKKSLQVAFFSGLSLYFLAVTLMVVLQAWVFRSLPQFRTEAIFLMLGFGLLAALLATLIASQIFNDVSFARQLTYLPTYLVLVILGERITFARIGMAKKHESWGKKEPHYTTLGITLIVGILIDVMLEIDLIALLNFIILGVLTVLILSNDTGTKKSLMGTKFHDFQRWTLQGAYSWLLLGILLLTWHLLSPSLLIYDAGLHAITLGFIITMFLAHAPTVLPTVFGKPAVTKLPKGMLLVVAFWIITAVRIFGNVLQVFFMDVPFKALVALTGYLSIIPILAYMMLLISQMKSIRKEPMISIR